jgi:Asparaginase
VIVLLATTKDSIMNSLAEVDDGNDRVLLAPSETGFALHAGTIESWRTNLPYQQAIERVLSEIAEIARMSLRSRASALDVVEAAVIAMEDCPFFNAGTGAAQRGWCS